MSSSRLMDAGKAIVPGQAGVSKSIAFVLVGLVGMVFMCGALFWVGSSVFGWAGDTVVAQIRGENNYSDYGPGEPFPVITSADKAECRGRHWQVIGIDIGQSIIHECHPQ